MKHLLIILLKVEIQLDGVDDWDLRYTNESLEEFLKDNQLISTTGADGSHITYDNMLYKNVNTFYAADYADGVRCFST